MQNISFTSIPRSVIRTAMQIKAISKKQSYLKQKLHHKLLEYDQKTLKHTFTYPNITAFQSIILLSYGAPLIPAGGSCCNLLKSLINLFLAGVDIFVSCPNLTNNKANSVSNSTRADQLPNTYEFYPLKAQN